MGRERSRPAYALLLLVLVIVLFVAGAVISSDHRHVTAAERYAGVALVIAAVVVAAFAAGLIWSGPWLLGGKAVPRETPGQRLGQLTLPTASPGRVRPDDLDHPPHRPTAPSGLPAAAAAFRS